MKPIYSPYIYRFLSLINRLSEEPIAGKTILDVGAGGGNPPLGLFADYGMFGTGIDINAERIEAAKKYAEAQNLSINFQEGDMRQIPFEDNRFDFVYEFYSMCHLRKRDTLIAIEEMKRVLKPGGFLFLGFMSADTWPLTGKPNEYNEWMQEEAGEKTIHTVFFDEEAFDFVRGLEIIFTEKERRLMYANLEKETLEEWMSVHEDDWFYDREEWEKMYEERLEEANYSHRFFLLKKPA